MQSPKARIYLKELLAANQIPVDGGRIRSILRFHPRDLIRLAFLIGLNDEAGEFEVFIGKIEVLGNHDVGKDGVDEVERVMRFFSEPFVASLGSDAIKQVIGCTIRHELPTLIDEIHKWLGGG